jgi:hypothetical protein
MTWVIRISRMTWVIRVAVIRLALGIRTRVITICEHWDILLYHQFLVRVEINTRDQKGEDSSGPS